MQTLREKSLKFIKYSKKRNLLQILFLFIALLFLLVYPGVNAEYQRLTSARKMSEFLCSNINPDDLVITVGGNFNPRTPWHSTRSFQDTPLFCSYITALLTTSDLNILSLTAPFISENLLPFDKSQALGMPPRKANLLQENNIGLVQISGNNILDFGAPGLVNTLTLLGEKKIVAAGAGLNRNEAIKPYYFHNAKLTAGVLALNANPPPGWEAGENRLGVATADNETIRKLLPEMEEKADIIVVLVSFGDTNSPRPTNDQKSFARALINAGADIVIGMGGNLVQETELYQQGIIFYNLGNITPSQVRFNYAKESILLQIVLSANGGSRVIAYPLSLGNTSTEMLFSEIPENILSQKIFWRLRGEVLWQRKNNFFFLELPFDHL